ncbi:DNA mismatch repair protein MutT [Syntrophotalea acetylenivorans]|uniref:8-oxo-dGTP diphosphatase n=1 Tax=Syntrophotalea acetylenivorans TaxID=1842532 RepID=A0A1L3GRR8_9BACT|nr:(deoxy)nucleoside triphosphate pyrophosphohydrolase [Syntrophotalea acetylenivorans]APG28634.1 DNA mismatch repair protein MutT [Syntrophotalea acetylenivorans]
MPPLIVTAALLRKDSKILITKRPADKQQGGFWEFPGGKLQNNETPQQALKRELREELDLEIEVGAIFEVVYHRYDWGPVLILVYECLPLSEAIRNLEVDEHRWLTVEQLPEYDLLPADRPIIDKLLQQ